LKIELLKKHIYDLEKRLLQPEIRSSMEKLAEIISDDFFEFCSSGSIYFFDKNDVQDEILNSTDFNCEIKDFKIQILSSDVILATYKAIKHHESRKEMKYSLRSSVWKFINGEWKIIFHQGTPTKEF
jgi:hypothetical protein